ncbi:MAG: prolyl oligopeptidase family serine peptidase [Lachnospiraceae bacterium]|nr:prolyl oligopeptidase family serine peptidase [Lachnospiraceae bacterium]
MPSLFCYGAYDKVQPFAASKRLDAALTKHGIPHDYLIAAHSGHDLQNDNAVMHEYSQKMEEYLDTCLPIDKKGIE